MFGKIREKSFQKIEVIKKIKQCRKIGYEDRGVVIVDWC